MFYTNGNKEFVLEPENHTETNFVFTHGTNCNVLKSAYDDTEIVNDLIVLGENIRYHTIESFSGNGSLTTFTLEQGSVSTRITVGGVEKEPEEDYEVDSVGKTITFTTAPSGTILVDYEFEKPLYIRGTKQSSIDTHGVHAKKLIMPWIKTRNDGVRFVQQYLSRYKDIRLNIKVSVPTLFNSIAENDIVHLTNTIKNIDSDFVVKGITWMYPEYITQLNLGEYSFDFLEIDQQLTQKIHDLEDSMTTNKEIREYESPEELLALTDGIVINVREDKTETLNIADSAHIYDKTLATYSVGHYGSRTTREIYG
jgi:hypothetical protein